MKHPLGPDYLGRRLLPLDTDATNIPSWSHSPPAARPRQAAVLIPLLAPAAPAAAAGLLLTRRAEHLKQHPGEISFPGGTQEPDDHNLLATAIRETAEETGILPEYVQPVGILGELDTISGYRLRAYVGWVRPGFTLVRERSEVAELITVDSAQAINTGNFSWQRRTTAAGTFKLPEINLHGHRVWGVTGVILWRLAERLMNPEAG